MSGAMTPPSPLDDPDRAAFAWRRFRRLMGFMGVVTVTVVVISLVILHHANGPLPIHFYIAAALGIGLSMLLTAALMGLVFLSSGTGHDESIEDPLDDERD
jgi:peptidoglycan/LPS O-acetylase OafA/YrhL